MFFPYKFHVFNAKLCHVTISRFPTQRPQGTQASLFNSVEKRSPPVPWNSAQGFVLWKVQSPEGLESRSVRRQVRSSRRRRGRGVQACWRCRKYKKPCDGNPICSLCLTGGFRVWPSRVACRRDVLETIVDNILPRSFPDLLIFDVCSDWTFAESSTQFLSSDTSLKLLCFSRQTSELEDNCPATISIVPRRIHPVDPALRKRTSPAFIICAQARPLLSGV
ncbi:hypothetical protein EDD37DRAFT_306074 [Exophiala viscosa]|uniref:uncharacterized protein n=1 Tax=Exophiala viscosa TaxID=2486360 RepID=UPI0021A195EF|nr:hypothetical protein EDD37DRAFT_306074 [Exophiala viscosa]